MPTPEPLVSTTLQVVAGTVVVGGAGVATVLPQTPGPSATGITPAPTPTLPAGEELAIVQLKYRLIDRYGPVGARPGIFYCDPDFYPVARADEQSLAARWFAGVDRNSEEFRAIAQRLNLQGLSEFTPPQQLQLYRAHKQLGAISLTPSGHVYSFALRIAPNAGDRNGLALQGTITPQGQITVLTQQPTLLTCPICLARDTRIDTPGGYVAVQDIRPGELVWTVSSSGERVAAPVVATIHMPVSAGFQIVHLRLSDGRELFASPGHPTADGRIMGDLVRGDTIDGARVVSAERVAYGAAETYDILPSGGTGSYWADGILVGSTLAPAFAAR